MSGSGEMAKMPGMGGSDIKSLLSGEGASSPQPPPSPTMQSPDQGASPSLSLTGGNSGLGQIGSGPLQSSFGQRSAASLPASSSGPGAVFTLPGFADQTYTPNSSIQKPLQNTTAPREDPHSNLLKAVMLEMQAKMGNMGGALQTVNQQVGAPQSGGSGGSSGGLWGANNWRAQMGDVMSGAWQPPKTPHPTEGMSEAQKTQWHKAQGHKQHKSGAWYTPASSDWYKEDLAQKKQAAIDKKRKIEEAWAREYGYVPKG